MNTLSLRLLRALIAFFSMTLVLLGASAEPLRQVPQAQSDISLSFAPVVKKAQPAVVNVYASRTDKRPRNPLFRRSDFSPFFR